MSNTPDSPTPDEDAPPTTDSQPTDTPGADTQAESFVSDVGAFGGVIVPGDNVEAGWVDVGQVIRDAALKVVPTFDDDTDPNHRMAAYGLMVAFAVFVIAMAVAVGF